VGPGEALASIAHNQSLARKPGPGSRYDVMNGSP
jgi:hypothetical protein